MEAGGAKLREVGTTNRTRLSDYENAIDESTAALMKVHTSNYRIEGFTESVEIEQLVELGRRRNLPVIHDTGSGLLRKMNDPVLADEPDASTSIAAGADLVLFSGDKLLGGPQCGIIIGKKQWIERIESNPLMRAMRVDKLTLAALGATLQLHRDPQLARQHLPIYRMLDQPITHLEHRAMRIIEQLRTEPAIRDFNLTRSTAHLGGGSLPTKAIPSIALRLTCADRSEHDFARGLRTGTPPVISRVQQGATWLDLRTVFPDQDEPLIHAIRAALKGGPDH
jgi:L-seryl-tRNA(Ser) seleniumtransferase